MQEFFERVSRFAHRQIQKAHHLQPLLRSLRRNVAKLSALAKEAHQEGRKLIAIAKVEHLGDIVACEPVARYARKIYPDDNIVWISRAPYLELIQNNPHIDQAICVECLTEWIELRRRSLFDHIIDLHIQGQICLPCNIPLAKSEGNLQIPTENYLHFGSLLRVSTAVAGIPTLNDAPRVYITDKIVESVNAMSLPERFVVVHCRSNNPKKDWRPEKWVELAQWITHQYHLPMLEVGSASLLNAAGYDQSLNYCGALSILETAEVIRRAALFIGVDSGPAHLANAVGTFGIVLLGKFAAFKKYQPFSGGYADGANAILLYSEKPIAEMPVLQARNAVQRALERKSFSPPR